MTTSQTALLFPGLVDPKLLDAGDAADGWYTPPWLVEKARLVLGGIDLDPATCGAAQSIIKAERFYTEHENGLLHDWRGRVWLNPPYSAVQPWVDKLLAHMRMGDVPAALVLTNGNTDAGWWHDLAANGPVLFFRGRLSFWHPDKQSHANRSGQTLMYLGPDHARFFDVFRVHGIFRP